MKTRVISALIMTPLFLIVVNGGSLLLAACHVVSAMGMHELYNGWRVQGLEACRPVGYTSQLLLYGITYAAFYSSMDSGQEYITVLYGLWAFLTMCMALCVSLADKEHNVFKGPLGALGVLYPGFFAVHLALTEHSYGNLVYFIFLIAFGSDTFAYFSGYFFGKHKLCPNLSPKKTVEGAVGGVLCTALCSLALSFAIAPKLKLHMLLISLFGSVFSMFGDLVASAFKRKMGIKDYSNLIPGHGGIMDRFDSVLFLAPFVYYCLRIISMTDPGLFL